MKAAGTWSGSRRHDREYHNSLPRGGGSAGGLGTLLVAASLGRAARIAANTMQAHSDTAIATTSETVDLHLSALFQPRI